jgi:hypothetical protein
MTKLPAPTALVPKAYAKVTADPPLMAIDVLMLEAFDWIKHTKNIGRPVVL